MDIIVISIVKYNKSKENEPNHRYKKYKCIEELKKDKFFMKYHYTEPKYIKPPKGYDILTFPEKNGNTNYIFPNPKKQILPTMYLKANNFF